MSWFSKEEKTVVTDLGAVAEKHKATEDQLAQDYDTGLAIIQRVREDASAHAHRLQAEAAMLLRAAESVGQRFVVDAPTIPAKGFHTPVVDPDALHVTVKPPEEDPHA